MAFAADEEMWILDIHLDKEESDLLVDVKEVSKFFFKADMPFPKY